MRRSPPEVRWWRAGEPYTVARELGHGSGAMVEHVHSHLGTMRHRTEVVEYRIEQHEKALAHRLPLLDAVLGLTPGRTP